MNIYSEDHFGFPNFSFHQKIFNNVHFSKGIVFGIDPSHPITHLQVKSFNHQKLSIPIKILKPDIEFQKFLIIFKGIYIQPGGIIDEGTTVFSQLEGHRIDGKLIQIYNNCLGVQSTMKYKKQLRWLLFLLIPFVALLGILILTPLQIFSFSYPIANKNYNFEKINLSHNKAQSLSTINSNTLQNILTKYLIYLDLFQNGQSQSTNFVLENSSQQILPAFQYINANKNSINKEIGKIYQSMWFSSNKEDYQTLTDTSKLAFDLYAQNQLFLRAMITSSTILPIIAITVLYETNNDSIVFEYPTSYNTDYETLSSPTYGTVYPKIISAFSKNSPQIDTIAKTIIQNENGKSVLVVCNSYQLQDFKVLPCIKFNQQILGQQFSTVFQQNSSDKFNIVINSEDSQTVLIQRIYQFTSNILTNFSNSLLDLSIKGLQKGLFLLRPFKMEEQIAIQVNSPQTYFVTPIVQPKSSFSPILFNLVTQHLSQKSVISSIDSKSGLDTVVILTTILTIVGSIISTVVLKILLDSIDKELSQLQNRCKFIVGDDINIEIPQHKGTKDISEVYRKVRIINKLHRYSTNTYFAGPFAERVLKYNEALQFLNGLGYDTGNLLENMGDCYLQIQQWDKSINCLKTSAELGVKRLKQKFNLTVDEILRMKIDKKSFPNGYKQLQLILIRRFFKMTFTHIKYIQMRSLFQKADKFQSQSDQQTFKKKMEQLSQDLVHYTSIFRKFVFPQFSCYSQYLILAIFEAKLHVNLNKYDDAFKLLEAANRHLKQYTTEFPAITKKLKEKGSKFKLFHMKNKLTGHSRVHPDILKMVAKMTSAKLLITGSKSLQKYNKAFLQFQDGFKDNVLVTTVGFLFNTDYRKTLLELKIDPTNFQSTQIFRQMIPFKTLHYGEITKQIEPQLMKFALKTSPGLEREYVIIADCGRNIIKNQEAVGEYQIERAEHIFDKLIKPRDRISIVKFNLKCGMKIECNLTLKEANEIILKREIVQCFREQNQSKGSLFSLVQVLQRTLQRVKNLKSQKVIVLFPKSIAHYSHLSQRLRRKKRTQTSMKSSRAVQQILNESDDLRMQDFGDYLIDAVRLQGLRNLKIIFMCGPQDSIQDFRNFFGLQDINRRIWQGYNLANIVVYIISEKHKSDIDRILMSKANDIADNHYFIL